MLSEARGQPLVDCDNKEGVTALREVADDCVRFDENVQQIMTDFISESRRQLRVTTGERTFLEAASLRAMEDEDDADPVEADEDVEELPADPEAISLKAKTQTEEDAAVDSELGEEEVTRIETPEGEEIATDVAEESSEIEEEEDDE